MSRSVIVQKHWGYEEIIHNGEYCCKRLVYTKDLASSLHFHERKHETFVVATGLFAVQSLDGLHAGTRYLGAGEHIVLPPRTVHRVRCITVGFIVEASTHDDPEDCVRIIPSEQ